MLHNYHTPTFRNHHAVGTEREYIEAAIAGGYQTLGFSEHAPYQFPDGIVSYFHMFPEDLENYAVHPPHQEAKTHFFHLLDSRVAADYEV